MAIFYTHFTDLSFLPQAGDEEVIVFLFSQYEEVKDLNI